MRTWLFVTLTTLLSIHACTSDESVAGSSDASLSDGQAGADAAVGGGAGSGVGGGASGSGGAAGASTGGASGSSGDGGVDLDACSWQYLQPGCGDQTPDATCVIGPQDACSLTFCSCEGVTFNGGCGFSHLPFAHGDACAPGSD